MGSAVKTVPEPQPSATALVAVLQASLDAGGVATLGTTRTGEIIHASDSFMRMMGIFEPTDPPHGTLSELVAFLCNAGDSAAEVAAVLTLDPSTALDRRQDLALSDGRIIEWGCVEIEDGGHVWTFRHVTGYRHIVRAVSDAENWLRMFSAHADGVLFEIDIDTRIVAQWSQNTSLFDTWHDGSHDMTIADAIGGSQGKLVGDSLRNVFVTGRPASFEYVAERGGGQRVFAANAVLLRADEGAPPTVTVLIRDVTERSLLQRQLLQAERLASLGLLAAGVAHEVNNPLTYMQLNMQHVLRGLRAITSSMPTKEVTATVADLERCVTIAVEGAERVQEIVQDLRRFSRSDDHEPHRVIDVRDVLAFTIAMLGAEVEKRARIVRDFGPVPKVLAGEGRLNQVFLNLIINAIQAIEERGGDDHEVRLVTFTDEVGNAVVEVQDTGIGIPEEHRSKIFDPFFTTKVAGVGTGLGLAICHSITTSFDGTLTMESEPGVGSVFRVVLPPTTVKSQQP